MKFFNTQVAYIPQDYVFINVRKKELDILW